MYVFSAVWASSSISSRRLKSVWKENKKMEQFVEFLQNSKVSSSSSIPVLPTTNPSLWDGLLGTSWDDPILLDINNIWQFSWLLLFGKRYDKGVPPHKHKISRMCVSDVFYWYWFCVVWLRGGQVVWKLCVTNGLDQDHSTSITLTPRTSQTNGGPDIVNFIQRGWPPGSTISGTK